jgi:putative transposase
MLRGWGCIVLTTWKYRIKDSGSASKALGRMACAVNQVWNFSKATQRDALTAKSARLIEDKKTGKEVSIPNFLSAYDLGSLTAGSSKELGIHSQTIQAITDEYTTRRKQFKKLLRWRGKKSLGWIPWKAAGVRIEKGVIRYCKKNFRYWNSRKLPEDAKIKCGSFNQDARGRWYVSITFESEQLATRCGDQVLGGDIGIKTLLSLSDGTKIDRPNLRQKHLDKLKKLEKTRRHARKKASRSKKYGRLPKAKQVANLAAKVANKRSDYLHKESTKLITRSRAIAVGDVPCRLMNRSKNLSGISLDSGIGAFKNMLHYKAKRAGVAYQEVSERDSTQTCSNCGWKHPRRIGLGVREWVCGGCKVEHDRDTNAARNILATYHLLSAQDVVRCPARTRKR